MADTSQPSLPLDEPIREPDRAAFDFADVPRLLAAFFRWCLGNPAQALLLAVLAGVIGFAYFGIPAFLGGKISAAQWIMAGWSAENDQQHCWGIIPVAVALVLFRWREIAALPKQGANSGLWVAGAGVLLFIAGVRCTEARYTIFALPLLFVPELRPFRGSRRKALAAGGSRVQAEFDGIRPVLDLRAMRRLARSPGSVSLEQQNGQYRLLHNGQPRDPFDALVQRELGLRYVLQARWTDSRSGIEYFFESAPLDENPERHARGRTIPVFIDPQDPQRYRMDLSFLPGQSPATPRSSVISPPRH